MAINKKLITFDKKLTFLGANGINNLSSPVDGYYNLIPTWSMVFIKDTGEIWHDGVYFGKPIKDQIAPIMSGTTKGIVFTPNGTDYYYKDFNLWGNTFDGDTKNINGDLVVQGVTYKWTYGDLGIKKGNTNLISFSNSANDYDVFIPNGDLLVTGGDINVNNGKVILDSTGYIKGTHILNTNSYFNADNTLGKTWSSIKQFNTSGTTISLDTTRPAIINIQEHAHASGTLWVPWIAGGDITELSSWGIGLGGDAFYIGRIAKAHTENSLSEYWKFDATDGITISGATKYIKVADLSGASEKVFMADGTVKALSDITSEAVIGEATTTNYGGFKLTQDKASSQQSLVANTTGNGRYAVKMNANGTLYVEFSQANTWLPATNSQEGYVPQLSGENDAIGSSLNDYVLTFTSSDAETIYPTWRRLPSNAFDNTWRGIYVDNTSKLGTGTTTKPINFKAGTGITLTFTAAGNNTYNTLQIDGTTYSTATDSTLGLVKVGTTLDNVTGFTAVHIKDGKIYYKDTTYSFSNLKFQLTSGTDLMTYNSLAAKTILAGTGITFSYLNNVLTISSDVYSTATSSILGLVKVGTTLEDTTGYTKVHIDDSGFIYYHDTTYSFSKLKFQQTSGTDLMTYDSQAARTILAGDNITFTHSSNVLTIKATDTWTKFVGATDSSNGTAGYIDAPGKSNKNNFLRGDGTWLSLESNVTTNLYVGASNGTSNSAQSVNGNVYLILKEGSNYDRYNIVGSGRTSVTSDANGKITINTPGYSDFSAATATAAGTSGLVPGPAANILGSGGYFLRADGTWAKPVDKNTWRGIYVDGTSKLGTGTTTKPINFKAAGGVTLTFTAAGSNAYNTLEIKSDTYSTFVKSGTTAAAGLVPKPPTTAGTTKFLREDGTWDIPTNTWKEVSTSQEGYVPKIVTTGSLTSSDNPFILVYKNVSGTTKSVWVPLPANAFNDTWTAADFTNAGYVPKSVKGKFLHAKSDTGALEWVDDNNTWDAASTSKAGYVPKLVTGGGTIASSDTAYVLAYKSGVSGTTAPVWILLPSNAYKNSNTQYYLTLNGTVNGTAGKTNLGTFYAVATSDTTTADQVWMRNSSNNGYGWRTLGSHAFDSTTYSTTDENVKQTPKTDNVNRPLMMINGGTTAGEQTTTTIFSTSIYANTSTNMITANGFIKAGSDSSHVLLGDGGHKSVNDWFQYEGWWTSTDTHDLNDAHGMLFAYHEHTNAPFPNWGIVTTFEDKRDSHYRFLLASNGYTNGHVYYRNRSLDRGGWLDWVKFLDSSNYTEYVNNYYWANIKVSTTLDKTTTPTFGAISINTTNTPANKLEIVGSTANPNVDVIGESAIASIGLSRNDGLYIGLHSNGSGKYTPWLLSAYWGTSSTKSTDHSYNISLNPNGGNVGIGTIDPSYPLHVNGGAYIHKAGYNTLILNNSGNPCSSVRFTIAGTEYGAVEAYSDSYSYGTVMYHGSNYVNLDKDGVFKHHNTWTFWHTGNDSGLLTNFSRTTSTNKLSITVGGTSLDVTLGARAWDDTAYLPLTGGTITTTGNQDVGIYINTPHATAWLGFNPSDGSNRYLGVDNDNNLKYLYNSITYNVLHSNNWTSYVTYLPTCYLSGDKPDPLTYFNQNIGVKVAMTRNTTIGGNSCWHDTLWINGYHDWDVPNMCALTFKRNGTPRFFISAQSNRDTAYGTYYEVITEYNWTDIVDGRYLKLTGGDVTGNTSVTGTFTANGTFVVQHADEAAPNTESIKSSAFVCIGEYNDDALWIGKNTDHSIWLQAGHKNTARYGLDLNPLGGWVKINGYTPITSNNISSLHVQIADWLPTKYDGGDRPNPQLYFNLNIGLRVAMTRSTTVDGLSGWFDTLWINGYHDWDVPNMVAIHTSRKADTPRMWISSQSNRATSYGTWYEVITKYNFNWSNLAGKPTSKTAWGQTYVDSSGNFLSISGALSSVTTITMSQGITAGGSTKGAWFGPVWDGLGSSYNDGGALVYAYGGKPIYFYTNGITAFIQNGKVGINTTAPICQLEVAFTGSANPDSSIIANSAKFAINRHGDDGLYFGVGDGSTSWIQSCFSGRSGVTSATHTYKLSLNPLGGYVGIGTTNPSSALEVNGDVRGTNFYTTSDRNKKQNISSFSEHIRKFQLKDTEKWHYGVIALEVEEMFRDGEEGNMTVNYNSVLSYYIGLLENRVKELEEKINKLENK